MALNGWEYMVTKRSLESLAAGSISSRRWRHSRKRCGKVPIAFAAAMLLMTMHTTIAAKSVVYYYADPQGTVLAATDAQGNLLQSQDYHPYGLGTASSTSGPGFTGHVFDEDMTLIYMQQRYYDPQVGLFLSVDPVGLKDTLRNSSSRYRYGENNPFTFTDPDGRQSWCTPGNCGAGAFLTLSNQFTYVRENFDFVASGKIANGPGIELSYNITRAKGELNFLPVAQGAEVSLDLRPKQGLKFDIVDHPVNGKLAMSGGPSVDIAAIVKVSMELKYNPGGSVEITPTIGAGLGEFIQFAPAINVYEWQDVPDQDQSTSQAN